jgi:hypothetical protein
MNILKSHTFDNRMKESKFLLCASRANFSIAYILIVRIKNQNDPYMVYLVCHLKKSMVAITHTLLNIVKSEIMCLEKLCKIK